MAPPHAGAMLGSETKRKYADTRKGGAKMTAHDYYVISMLMEQRMAEVRRAAWTAPATEQAKPPRLLAILGLLAALTATAVAVWQ